MKKIQLILSAMFLSAFCFAAPRVLTVDRKSTV